MKKLFIILSIFSSVLVFALEPSQENEHHAFCYRNQNTMSEIFESTTARIAIENNGGLFNGGVCWWHSRLQRASFYLTRFAPTKHIPNSKEAKTILEDLAHLRRVVEIPGYSNFYDFTKAFAKEVQDVLNEWQIRDGVLEFGWQKGLSGFSHLSQNQMKVRMDNLYQDYLKTSSENHLLWILQQRPGIVVHSLLVISMNPVNQGYDLKVINSNDPGTVLTIAYHEGDTAIIDDSLLHIRTYVPYSGYENDNLKIDLAINKECSTEYNTEFMKQLLHER